MSSSGATRRARAHLARAISKLSAASSSIASSATTSATTPLFRPATSRGFAARATIDRAHAAASFASSAIDARERGARNSHRSFAGADVSRRRVAARASALFRSRTFSTPVRSARSSDRRTPRTQTDRRARASRTTTGYATTAVNSGSIARAVKTPAHTIDYDVSNHTVARAGDPDKRAFTYFVMTGGRMIYASALRLAVLKFLLSMSATADVLALASLEVDLSKVELGSTVTVKWRGKPVFIRRRTPAEIAKEESVDVASLRDPQADSERAPNQEWLVAVGVCTHLGCVPIANAGDYNGWFCPCHGSHYDASGRIRKGPAPENLEIPEYKFLDGDKMLIG